MAQHFIIEIGVHIGEDCAAWPESIDPGKRVVDTEVARMRCVAQSVDDLKQRKVHIAQPAAEHMRAAAPCDVAVAPPCTGGACDIAPVEMSERKNRRPTTDVRDFPMRLLPAPC